MVEQGDLQQRSYPSLYITPNMLLSSSTVAPKSQHAFELFPATMFPDGLSFGSRVKTSWWSADQLIRMSNKADMLRVQGGNASSHVGTWVLFAAPGIPLSCLVCPCFKTCQVRCVNTFTLGLCSMDRKKVGMMQITAAIEAV